MKTVKIFGVAGSLALLFGASSSFSATLPVYKGPAINWSSSPACLAIGDAYGCSLPLLNYFAGLSPNTQVPTGYVIPTPQGALNPYIVLQGGGVAPDNTIPYGASARVEDGYKSNDGSADSFLATGKTSTTAGNMNDPDNNGLLSGEDLLGTWDVGLGWLIGALSPSGVRRELMIGFDYNQPQNALTSLNSLTSLNYWALVTVRDREGILSDVNYEIRRDTGLNPYAWTTGKNIDSKPLSTEFSTVNGVTCVDTNGSETVPILPISGGNCPSGYEVKIDNAQSTSDTEIVAFMPELNDGLEGFLAAGYDTVSVRMLFGCFGERSTGKKPGIGYLADEANGGATNQCESGGFPDVFLLAGAPENQTPEPGSLVLIAAAFLGLGLASKGTKRTA